MTTTDIEPADRVDRLAGVLLGTAVGDALGLPREGLSRRRAAKLFGEAPLRHRFVLGRGMISDDTEHACLTAEALLVEPDDDARFARKLAWKLRGWLLAMPAGVGWGTLRAIVKLWLGFPPSRSGVVSAGNGAAMRAPILGACLAHRPDLIAPMSRASTRLTHRDRRAEEGALVVAIAAARAARGGVIDPADLHHELRASVTDEDLSRALDATFDALARDAAPADLAASLGLSDGVSGFILHTVPAALYGWLHSRGCFRRCVEDVILLGGDADSTGAIAGGLAGATVGARGIPPSLLDGIVEYPRSLAWMRRLAEQLATRFPERGAGEPASPPPLFWPAIPARNLLFLAIALGHGFRRMLPPW